MGGRNERNWSRTIKRDINGVARLKRRDSEHATETRGCLIEIEIEDDTGKLCGYTNAWLFLVLPSFLLLSHFGGGGSSGTSAFWGGLTCRKRRR